MTNTRVTELDDANLYYETTRVPNDDLVALARYLRDWSWGGRTTGTWRESYKNFNVAFEEAKLGRSTTLQTEGKYQAAIWELRRTGDDWTVIATKIPRPVLADFAALAKCYERPDIAGAIEIALGLPEAIPPYPKEKQGEFFEQVLYPKYKRWFGAS